MREGVGVGDDVDLMEMYVAINKSSTPPGIIP